MVALMPEGAILPASEVLHNNGTGKHWCRKCFRSDARSWTEEELELVLDIPIIP